MLLKFLFFTVVTIHSVLAQEEENLDDLINQVFPRPADGGSTPPTNRNPNLDVPPNNGGGIPGVGSCECVPYYLCKDGKVNTNGEGVIDIRINEGPCGSYLDVCCGSSDKTFQPTYPTPPPVEKIGCGYRNPDGIGFRITGDEDNEAQYGEFPWMVAVLREETIQGNPQKLNVYQCGGALIHPEAVVTAAHCVSGKDKKFKIRAGEWDTQTKNELYPHQDRDVSDSVVHEEYYAGALYNDIAILFLDTPVDIAENVNVVCLPEQDANFDSSRCFASGWGKDVFGKEGKYQVILKKIDLPIIPRDTCQQQLRKTRLSSYFELHESFICAGGEEGKDTCKGDGGSPLVCPIPGENDRYYHAGIVSWGIQCGDPDVPGVYVNVAGFRDWIDRQMRLRRLDTSSYKV